VPIAVAFTLTSFIAMVGLNWIHRELWLNFRAIKKGRRNGLGLESSWMLLVLISTLSITNGILLTVGIGALLGVRAIGFLLAVIPLVKLGAAILVIRSLRKQVRLYRKERGLR